MGTSPFVHFYIHFKAIGFAPKKVPPAKGVLGGMSVNLGYIWLQTRTVSFHFAHRIANFCPKLYGVEVQVLCCCSLAPGRLVERTGV